MNELIIIGASGHGKVVADIAKNMGYEHIAFLDDNESIKECGGYPVLGVSGRFPEFDCDFAVAVGNAAVRRRITDMLTAAYKSIPTLIHPQAVIGENVSIARGSVVMAGAVINPGTRIGRGCIINTCASADHDCVLGDFVHLSVGAHLAGTVSIGENVWIGIGAVVSNNISVTDNCMIGAGAVVVKDITERGTYIGVPARRK